MKRRTRINYTPKQKAIIQPHPGHVIPATLTQETTIQEIAAISAFALQTI